MKKLILIFCLFTLTAYNTVPYSTTWAGNANNQALSKTAFLNGISTQNFGNSVGSYTLASSQELLTKAEVTSLITWSGLNTSDPEWVATASNQAVTKTDISIAVTASTTSTVTGCGGTSGSQTIYFDVATGIVYTNASMSTVFVGSGNYYTISYPYSAVESWQINSSGQVIGTCYP